MREQRATIGDVARLAGVSKATVSRVVNGSASVQDSTRRRVEEAVRTTGYATSWQAKSLATGRAGAIGVIITEPFDEVYTDPTFAAVLRGVYDAMASTALVPILLQASSAAERNKAMAFLERGGADAAIHLTPYLDDGVLPQLAAQGCPSVVVGKPDERVPPAFSAVYSDDVHGARLAAQRAAGRGRLRPLAVVGPELNPASVDRVAGYASVLGSGLEGRVVYGAWDEAHGRTAVRRALDEGTEVDVVLAGSDRIACGALAALQERGLRVPQDVAVIGFDNHAVAHRAEPPLTTIEQPLRREGEVAVDLALRLLAGEPRSTVVLQMHVVPRDSD